MNTPYSIDIDITKEDLREGLLFIYKNSKLKKMGSWSLPILFLTVTALGYPDLQKENGTTSAIVISLIVLILMILIAAVISKVWTLIAIRASLPKDSNTGILGRHEFLIEDSYVIEKTEANEAKFTWASVPHVKKGKKHIYLYQTEQSAHIFPLRAFENKADFESFYDLLKRLKVESEPVERGQ